MVKYVGLVVLRLVVLMLLNCKVNNLAQMTTLNSGLRKFLEVYIYLTLWIYIYMCSIACGPGSNTQLIE